MPARQRAQDPVRLLGRLREQLVRGWPPGLTVLSGDDLYHLDRAQRALLDALAGENPSGFGLTVYGDEAIDLSAVVAAARSQGMFSERRVVFVGDVAALQGDPPPLAEYAAAPPSDSYLIVRAPALDQRRKLHRALATAGQLWTFSAIDASEVGRLVGVAKSLAAERGLRLERGSAEMLVETCGGDLCRLAGELDKLGAWLGEKGGGAVPLRAVQDVAAGSGSMSGWEVADAVLRRDRAAALAAARRLVEAGDEPIRVVGGLAWRARMLLEAKARLAAGQRLEEVVRATRGGWYIQDELRRGLSSYSLAELLAFPARLLAADRMLKSRSIAPGVVLEQLIDGLTEREASPGTSA